MQGRDRVQTERTDVWTQEGTWRGGGMKRESKIDMYAPPCVNKIASGKLLRSTGRSAQGSVMTQRGAMWGVRGDILYNICVYKWLIHIVVEQKLTRHCKSNSTPIEEKKPKQT